jgi:hypothetical protein
MPIVHFIGRIIPNGIAITLSGLPEVDFHSHDTDLQVHIRFNVVNSRVDTECSVNRFTVDDLSLLHKIAFDTTRALVNLLNFSSGWGLIVAFEAFTNPDGLTATFCPMDTRLSSLCTAFVFSPNAAPSKSFNEIAGIVLKEPPLFMALNDC